MDDSRNFKYYYGTQADMYSFYRIPKTLFTNQIFKNLSSDAKILYGIMLDRMSLSTKNKWSDENGRIYIIFTVEEIMQVLNCKSQKVMKLLDELDCKRGIGLIERRRKGQGKANVIYVKNFIIIEKNQNFENQNPKDLKIKNPEFRKSKGNNTEINDIDLNNTNLSIKMIDEMDKRTAYREIIMENIEYPILCEEYPKPEIDEIVSLMTETVCTKKDCILINGEQITADMVKSRFLKMTKNHIEYVLYCMNSTNVQIRNIRQYLLTALYNAPATMNHFYKAEINHCF